MAYFDFPVSLLFLFMEIMSSGSLKHVEESGAQPDKNFRGRDKSGKSKANLKVGDHIPKQISHVKMNLAADEKLEIFSPVIF